MDSENKPYLTRVWPYLLAIVLLSIGSIVLGRYCSEDREPGYRVDWKVDRIENAPHA